MTRICSRHRRQTLRTLLRSSAGCAWLLLAACGVLTLEEQLLQRFFEASRLYDTAAVEKVATVMLNPVTDGVVQDFTVTDVEGNDSTRTVTVAAQLRTSDGRIAATTFIVTLEHRERWLITAIRRRASGGPG
jgi:hypothetical protein